jgi:hypothetical protein
MDRRVRAAIAGFQGTVRLYAKNLDTGETYGIGKNDKVRTASTIKLPPQRLYGFHVRFSLATWQRPQDGVAAATTLPPLKACIFDGHFRAAREP